MQVLLEARLTSIRVSSLGAGKPFTTISFDMKPAPPLQFFVGLSTV